MAKVVVRNRRKVYAVGEETLQERWDRKWLEKYNLLLEFIKTNGHQRFPFDKTSPNYKYEYVQLQRWAVHQRLHNRKGNLADWRYNLLVKAGFLFDPLETYWMRNYENLVEFKKINGHCNVSKFDKKYNKLGKWIGEQRYHRNNENRLTPERIKLLEDIGFDWGIKRNKWDKMYEWLKNYYTEHGVAYVQRDMSQGYSGNKLNRLNRWCGKQIWYNNRGLLPPDKKRLLEDINFDFNHLENILEDFWETQFIKLKEFHKKYGHYNVPVQWVEDKVLSRWVQRTRVYKDKLTDEKKERLDKIGFTWDYSEDAWEKHFQELISFKKANGHCNVFISENEQLGYWVRYMRKIKRRQVQYQMTEEQYRKLDEIGFDWDPRETFWEERFAELKEFKKEFGHCKVNMSFDKRLYIWCRSQRYIKDTIEENKKKMLDEIGFIW